MGSHDRAHMTGLYDLFMEQKMAPPTLEEFLRFYTLKAYKGNLGFYYFVKWTAKGLQAITKINKSLGNWKDSFFFTPEVGVRGHFGSPSKYL